MYDRKGESRRWLDQAENDLAFAEHALRGGFFHQACFVAQQCAEKEGVPHRVFTRAQAVRAIGLARKILDAVKGELED